MTNKEFDIETDLIFKIDEKVKRKIENKQGPEVVQVGVGANLPEMLGGVAAGPQNVVLREYATQIDKIKARVVFFDYKSGYFEGLLPEIDSSLDMEIIKEFEDLPKTLKDERNTVLFLNYSGYPRLCNQMIPLVKKKFKHVKITLTSKHLTPEKVKAHLESDLGVHDYLNMPFTMEDFYRVLLKYS